MKILYSAVFFVCTANMALACSCIPDGPVGHSLHDRSTNVFVAKINKGSQDPSSSEIQKAAANGKGYPIEITVTRVLKGFAPSSTITLFDSFSCPKRFQENTVYTFYTDSTWQIGLCNSK